MFLEAEALSAQLDELVALVSEFTAADWDMPTRCDPLSVREVTWHVAQGLDMSMDALRGRPSGQPAVDRYAICRWDGPSFAAEVVTMARDGARDVDDAAMRTVVAERAVAMTDAVSRLEATTVIGTDEQPVRSDEFVAMLCLETAVHTMDLGHATLKGERIAPLCVPIVAGIIDGLLEAKRPPSLGWDARTLILTGTGRRPLSPNERVTLGETVAGRFPVLT